MDLAVQALARALGVLERDSPRTVERPGGRDPDECAVEGAAGERPMDDGVLARGEQQR